MARVYLAHSPGWVWTQPLGDRAERTTFRWDPGADIRPRERSLLERCGIYGGLRERTKRLGTEFPQAPVQIGLVLQAEQWHDGRNSPAVTFLVGERPYAALQFRADHVKRGLAWLRHEGVQVDKMRNATR